MQRDGICVAGNMIVDILYPVMGLPRPGELTTIQEGITRSSGGALCNTIVDLAKLDPALKLMASGVVGADADGDFVLEKLRAHENISLAEVKREGRTSFTAVMADQLTKQRTFFHYRGANALFCENHIDWDKIDTAFFHIGYILLLDALDEEDPVYGTKMARLLKNAQEHGIKTSIDVVSEASDRFSRLVPPALKYTDYCIINELEAQQSTGVQLRDAQDRLLAENMREALKKLLEMGVSTWAVIHCPEGGYAMAKNGAYAEQKSLSLPEGYIAGSVGAGDAFCAGMLYAAQQGKTIEEGLRLATATAACSLGEADATSGVKTTAGALAFYEKMANG